MVEGPGRSRLLGVGSAWTWFEFSNVSSEQRTEASDDFASGPYDIWQHVHQDSYANYCVFLGQNSVLRKYGYVIWDIPDDSVPEESRRRLRYAQRQAVRDQEEIERERLVMEQSWKERASIYAKGGRGYWDLVDTSRITWETKKSIGG